MLNRNHTGLFVLRTFKVAQTQSLQDFQRYIYRLSDNAINQAIMLNKMLDVVLFMDENKFIAFIMRLSKATLAQLAANQQFIVDVALKQSLAAINFFYDKVPAKTINAAFMFHLQHNNNVLARVARRLTSPKNLLTALINRLDFEVVALAALMLGKEQHFTLLEELFKNPLSQPGILLLSRLHEDPLKLKKIYADLNHLRSIHFEDGGESVDYWSGITKKMLDITKLSKKNKYKFYHDMQRENVTASSYDFSALKYVELKGRTIVWLNVQGNYINVKVQRNEEKPEKLVKEYKVTAFLRKHASKLNLLSIFPEPKAIVQHENIFTWLSAHLAPDELSALQKMVGNNPERTLYVYEIDAKKCDYQTYLQNPSIPQACYEWANRAAVNDTYYLFARGVVFNQLADIFHNLEESATRADGGRYHVLINLFWGSFQGSGRVTQWKLGVRYPNVRGSGLADLGDCVSLREYHFTFQVLDMLASYQYVLFLIAGVRACELTTQARRQYKSDSDIDNIWLLAAQQVMTNCAQAVGIASMHSEAKAHAFLSSIVDVTQLARQMQYWMTSEYVADFIKSQVPPDIYGKDTDVFVDLGKFREGTFCKKIGCSIDGINQDLGPVNGQEPIKKANELFYWMINSILESFHQVRKTLNDLKTILRQVNLVKQEEIRKTSFTHLPTKSYHKIQMALCKERLKQKQPMTVTMRQEVEKEVKQHAAILIFKFWQEHRKKPVVVDNNNPSLLRAKL